MSQYGQVHFKTFTAFSARFLMVNQVDGKAWNADSYSLNLRTCSI